MVLWTLVAAAALIIAGLAGYAARLLWLVQQQQRQRAANQLAQQRQADAEALRYNARLWESLQTIAWATQQGQCCYSEGAIRLCVLLAKLKRHGQDDLVLKFSALHGLYQAIAHHPTHEARNHYSQQELRKLDKERLQLELKYADAITTELEQLLDWGAATLAQESQ